MTNHVMPVRRDLKLHLPDEQINTWHGNNRHITHFFNALSMLFPVGERFFMDSVRAYRDQITDPELKQAVTAFIGQEAMHSREHQEYNEAVGRTGLPAAELDAFTARLLGRVQKRMPKSFQLAATVCLEHYTAILGNMVLVDKVLLEGAHPAYQQIWRWHAMEETEHKGVAYDVWNAVIKQGVGSYLLRSTAMLITTAIFWPVVFYFHARLVWADPKTQGNRISGYGAMFKLMLGGKGRFWRLIPEFFEFFKPGFHPWDQDNRHLLEDIPTLMVEVNNAGRASALPSEPSAA